MGTRGEFKVAITKEDLVFAAAHFITFAGHRCEKLHGHNYRASLVVEGGLETPTGTQAGALGAPPRRHADTRTNHTPSPRTHARLSPKTRPSKKKPKHAV